MTHVAIITGASSGIGEETAVALARRGYHVVLAARREEKLRQVAERCTQAASQRGHAIEAVVHVTDVADREQVRSLVADTEKQFGRLDVMVNNAGYGLFARVVEISPQDMERIFQVNFHGVFYGCQAAGEIMMRQRHGHIFNVSSVIGKRGTPFHGAYCASKFALVGLGESLRVEMASYNVRVTTVCPALTATDFFVASARSRAAGSSFQKFKHLTPAHVVGEKIARAVGKRKPEIVLTAGGKFLTLLAAFCPGLTDRLMKFYHDDLVKRLPPE
ncbi:MAG: SDR family NAD(P)-dependent oxidoreductase [Phycisphaerae bacterium]|nr:SDR family NAD(P)-dependent oxidoreductase [Phycisphaerae bacterium]